MKVFDIPGKISGEWNGDVSAMIDTWESYSISLEDFKNAVLVKGVAYASSRGVKAWIVDSSRAKGTFTQEIQDFIGTDVFPKFAKIGVKYFITISSSVSSVTNMTVKNYAAKTGPHGLKLVTVDSVSDALKWLKDNA